MNILITGGTGFIGSRLALRCLDIGYGVRIFGQENTEAEKFNRKLLELKGAEVILGSIGDKEKFVDLVEDVDIVFHLAAAQHEANVSDQVFRDVNVVGTQNLLDACLSAGVQRFIHGSTIGVYGNLEGQIDEESPCNPDNIYGLSKLEGEKVVLLYKDKIPLVIIRISETFGPGDYRLLKLFKMIKKNLFFMVGSGTNLHQLIFIDDLVDGFLRAAESEKTLGKTVLLAGKAPITTNDMVKTIAECLNSRIIGIRAPLWLFLVLSRFIETTFKPLGIQPPLHRRRLDFFIKSFSFSNTKAKDLLDFTPRYSFTRGVAETARWYQENGFLTVDDLPDRHELPANMVIDPDLSAQIEPFDTFWEAPADVEKGFGKFAKFYKRNYFKFMPANRSIRTLVISCGAGYMVELMRKKGYTDVLGIDSDPGKIQIAERHELNCKVANAFSFLRNNKKPFNLIFAEQEINHLTKKEILLFLDLCRQNLTPGGILMIHSLNGANPVTGAEAISQNFDHFNTFTEYSLKQLLSHAGFEDLRIFPLNLYIFYENPINYIGMILSYTLNLTFRLFFIFYGKDNKLFSKKIGAYAVKPEK